MRSKIPRRCPFLSNDSGQGKVFSRSYTCFYQLVMVGQRIHGKAADDIMVANCGPVKTAIKKKLARGAMFLP